MPGTVDFKLQWLFKKSAQNLGDICNTTPSILTVGQENARQLIYFSALIADLSAIFGNESELSKNTRLDFLNRCRTLPSAFKHGSAPMDLSRETKAQLAGSVPDGRATGSPVAHQRASPVQCASPAKGRCSPSSAASAFAIRSTPSSNTRRSEASSRQLNFSPATASARTWSQRNRRSPRSANRPHCKRDPPKPSRERKPKRRSEKKRPRR